jgi:hypothetical protein
LQITAQGVISSRWVGVDAQGNGALGVASWLLGLDTGNGNQHSVAEYHAALQAWIDANPLPRERPPTPAPIERPNVQDRRELNRQEAAAVEVLFELGRRQNIEPPVLPKPRVLTAFKNGDIWVVAFGDTVIAVGPSRRRAQALARFGNYFLRRLFAQALVEPDAIVTELQNFFTNATTPGAGFNPLLQTQLPM